MNIENEKKDMEKGFVISDLHFFSQSSIAQKNLPILEEAMSQADYFIFNGDTFDFRWSIYSSVETTITGAIAWLNHYLNKFPNCHFYYLLGNHDCLTPFVKSLEDLENSHNNFSLHPIYLVLGDKLFTHGDAAHAHRNPSHLQRYRSNFDNLKNPHPFLKSFYKISISLGIQKLAPFAFSKKVYIRQLLKFLQKNLPGILEKTKHIYCGHSHVPFFAYPYRRWFIYNTGAMLQGMKFQLLQISNQ